MSSKNRQFQRQIRSKILHSSSSNMFVMLSNVLKRCEDLRIIPSDPSTMMTISNDSIATTDWQEMSIFEKVTVLRALCDARLNKADIDQVTEVNRSLEIH